MRVAYSVITFSGWPGCAETLNSIPAGSRTLIVDNSITDWPLAKAWNYSVDRLCVDEGYDAVVLCNDDIVLRNDIPDKDGTLRCTGDLLAEALLERQFVDERPCREAKLEIVSAYNTRDLPDVGPRWGTGPDFSCICVGPELFKTMGRFDEEFPLYFEDNDAHRRLRLAGFEALSYAPYLHYGSQTARREGNRYEDLIRSKFERSKVRYQLKWGGTPGEEQYARPFGGRVYA